MIEDMIVKYFWSASGYCLISIPVFFGPKAAKRATGALEPVLSAAEAHAADGKSVAARTESECSHPIFSQTSADNTQATSQTVVFSSPSPMPEDD